MSPLGYRGTSITACGGFAPEYGANEIESNADMEVKISGKDVSVGLVSVDTHRFGSTTGGSAIKPYALSVSRDRVLHDFQEYYDDYVADTAAYGTVPSEPVSEPLRDLKFPSFLDLFDNEPNTFAAFLTESDYDFLVALFSDGQDGRPHYFIRTVNAVTVGAESVLLEGLIFDFRYELLNKIAKQAVQMPNAKIIPPEDEPGFMSNDEPSDED